MSYIMVPNLEKWQHYKDRCPPWIKLHRDLLNDYEFSCLQDASKAHLMGIWLLASQMDNKVPADQKWIANKINATDKVDINLLIEKDFIVLVQDDSDMLAQCKQNALVETETETETETDNAHFDEFWNLYPRKEDKKKAMKSWNRLTKTKKEKAIQDIQTRFVGVNKKFIPYPTTYLNGERWDDEKETSQTTQAYGADGI